MSSSKKISVTIYVTPEQHAAVNRVHERTRVPRAVVYREAIDMVLAKYADTINDQTVMDFGDHDAE